MTSLVLYDVTIALTERSSEDYTSNMTSTNVTFHHNSSLDPVGASDTLRVMGIMASIVNPIVAVVGLLGNTASFVILFKSGIRKPSNIFLFALALADSTYLAKAIYIKILLACFGSSNLRPQYYGWEYPENITLSGFIIDRFMLFFIQWAGFVSTNLPVVITVERVLAIFVPLKFKTILTYKRARVVAIGVYLFWFPYVIFISALMSFDYYFVYLDRQQQYSTWFISDFIDTNILFIFDSYVVNYMTSILPVIIIIVGCLLIGIKIKLTHRKRKQMSSGSKKLSSRTTRTLLAVSLIFAFFQTVYFVIVCAMNDQLVSNGDIASVTIQFLDLLVFLCGSSNFYVYVFMNEKFRKIFFDLFVSRCGTA